MTHRDQGVLARAVGSGPPLYFYGVTPERPPAAVVGVVHGYGEYGSRYLRVMDVWAQRGIAGIAIDLRGHGRAGGRRGHVERFEEYLDDLRELERLTSEKKLPTFLFGHSLGGLIAVSSVLARPGPWRALALSAPLLGVALAVSPLKRFAGRLASRFWPTLALPNGVRSEDVTHDRELAALYDKDPLVFHIATPRWFTETEAAQGRAFARAPSLTLPLHVVMGSADPVSKVESARAFFDAAGARDKTWDLRPGLLHEVLNEPEWRPIAETIADFFLAKL
jgi:alpha-beta hydrolase superfamily lysophospholipase